MPSAVSHIYPIAAGDNAEASHVYAIAASNAVKIGKTRDIKSRLDNIQSSHYEPLKLAFSLPCDDAVAAAVERLVHRLLSAKRLRGEWFDVTVEEALAAIADAIEVIQGHPIQHPAEGSGIATAQIIAARTLL
jgi:hypothetical protein